MVNIMKTKKEQLKEQQREIEQLKAENKKLTEIIEKTVNEKCNDSCIIAKAYVKNFAEKLKQRITDDNGTPIATLPAKGIDELLKEYEE